MIIILDDHQTNSDVHQLDQSSSSSSDNDDDDQGVTLGERMSAQRRLQENQPQTQPQTQTLPLTQPQTLPQTSSAPIGHTVRLPDNQPPWTHRYDAHQLVVFQAMSEMLSQPDGALMFADYLESHGLSSSAAYLFWACSDFAARYDEMCGTKEEGKEGLYVW